VQLNEPEFLVALVLENLAKERDFVVLLDVGLDPLDNGGGPVDNKALEAVLLVQISVHVLLHGLDGQLALPALDVVLDLLLVDVVDNVLQLLQGNDLACHLRGHGLQSLLQRRRG